MPHVHTPPAPPMGFWLVQYDTFTMSTSIQQYRQPLANPQYCDVSVDQPREDVITSSVARNGGPSLRQYHLQRWGTHVRSLYISQLSQLPPHFPPDVCSTEARGVRGIAASFGGHIFSDSPMSGAVARPEHPSPGVARLLQREPPRRPTRLCDPRGPCHEVARRGVEGEDGGGIVRGRVAPLF